jgi:site-specific recombinase XerD
MDTGIQHNQQQYTVQYIVTKLAEEFSSFLTTKGSSKNTLKNYLADLRNFFAWLTSTDIKDSQKNIWSEQTVLEIITSNKLLNYRQSLILSHTPTATINRRLTTLRTFFSFAVTENYITNNPTIGLINVPQPNQSLTDDNLVMAIKLYEQNQRECHEWVSTDATDIREFFHWYTEQHTA